MDVGLLLIGSLFGNFILTVVLAVFASPDAAWWASTPGTCSILLGFLFYGVVFDSKKRWPHLNTWNRFARILTFGR